MLFLETTCICPIISSNIIGNALKLLAICTFSVRMESNGFAVQTSLWSPDNKQRFLNMEMSEVSVVCLSPSSCDDPVQSAEVKYMNLKSEYK